MEGLTTALTAIVGAVKQMLPLFAEFPLNVFVGCSVAVAVFRVVRTAKNSAKG